MKVSIASTKVHASRLDILSKESERDEKMGGKGGLMDPNDVDIFRVWLDCDPEGNCVLEDHVARVQRENDEVKRTKTYKCTKCIAC